MLYIISTHIEACNLRYYSIMFSEKKKLYISGQVLCPVKPFELYVSRLNPNLQDLWQQPKLLIAWNDEIWYNNEKLGKNKIQSLMPNLVRLAGLGNQSLTNHCIRSTCITILDQQGYEARHIMSVSGHKREESIKSYASKTSTTTKRQISDTLADVIVKPQARKTRAINENPKPKLPPNHMHTSIACKENFETKDDKSDKDDPSNLSFGELLELEPDEVDNLVKELFGSEIPIPGNVPSSAVAVKSNMFNPCKNTQQIVPKMTFNNSNITINFNVNK